MTRFYVYVYVDERTLRENVELSLLVDKNNFVDRSDIIEFLIEARVAGIVTGPEYRFIMDNKDVIDGIIITHDKEEA